MKNRAGIPYTDNILKLGRTHGRPVNKYWVVSYEWNEASERYERHISDTFVNRDHAGDYFRAIEITKELPRVEIWCKLKNKRKRLLTYKGLE